MTGDIFSSLMKGLSELMPGDEPCIKAFQIQTQIAKMKAKEEELYTATGKKVLAGDLFVQEEEQQLKQLQEKREILEKQLEELQNGKSKKDVKEECTEEVNVCQKCGSANDTESVFCQHCGNKIQTGQTPKCGRCGSTVEESARFCGKCGMCLKES